MPCITAPPSPWTNAWTRPSRPLHRPDRLDEVSPARPVDDRQLATEREAQVRLVARAVDEEDDAVATAPGSQRLEGRRDRRDGGLVTDEEMPVGLRVRPVATPGTVGQQGVPGPGRSGPRAGHALVAVDDEVDGQRAGGDVRGTAAV